MNANLQANQPNEVSHSNAGNQRITTKKKGDGNATSSNKSPSAWSVLVTEKLKGLSDQIEVPISDLQWWLDRLQEKHIGITPKEFEWLAIELLHLARTYHLDPLLGQVHAWQDNQMQWQVSVSLDGLLTLINRQPHFDGLCINESPPECEQHLAWAECIIYRKDRAIPTSIREYAIEVAQESDIWQKMPRRMLKNKAVQQCARMAFGFSGPIIGESPRAFENAFAGNESLTRPSFKMFSRLERGEGTQTERLKAHLSKAPENNL